MGHQQNVIELNGNHYDAVSGRLMKQRDPAQTKPQPVRQPTGQVLDGFRVRPKHPATKKPHTHAAASHAVHGKTERSKTLMRHAVKKPSDKPAVSTALPQHPAAVVRGATPVSPQRTRRAADIQRSRLISKFGSMRPGLDKKVAPLEVRQAPPEHAPHAVSMPIDAIDDIAISADMFDDALRDATGHEQPKAKKHSLRSRAAKKLHVSPRTFNIGAGVLVMLVVGGFIALRSIPQVAVKVAATRAGVRASLPGYQPSGFSLTGPVQYSSGQITLNYQSNSDDRAFSVVQKNSDWNSQALLENFVATSDKTYQTYQEKGRTVYTYEGNNATWVSGGVWYQVEADTALNSDQLRRIVSSL